MDQPRSILLGKLATIDLFFQFESASDRCVAFKNLDRPGSILLVGKLAAIDILLQFEPASDRYVAFKELVWPGPILLGKFVEIDALLQSESRAVEFRKLSLR